MDNNPIKLYLICGFLGAGKTTFMRSMIDTFQGKRLGVLVNEFGSIGIDGTLVKKSGIQLVEINNGSIFCACIKDGFVRTMKEFTQQPIDVLLIESSGMADPAGMKGLLDGLAPYLQRPYEYAGNVCLVDSTTYLDYVDMLMPIQNQVASADLIVVNKTDLVEEEQLAEIIKSVRELNADAPLYNTIYAHVPLEVLESQMKSRGYEGSGTNTPYNRPCSYALHTDAALPREALRLFCAQLAGAVLRFKGFVRNIEGGFWHIEGVAKQFSVEPADFSESPPPETGHVVVITFEKEDISPLVAKAWEVTGAEPLRINIT